MCYEKVSKHYIRHDEEQDSLYYSNTYRKEGSMIIWIKLDIEKRICCRKQSDKTIAF